MKSSLTYFPVTPENAESCRIFENLMLRYIAELNEHNDDPLPEAFQKKWIASILSMLGPEDRHLELCFDSSIPVGFLYGKIDHAEHKGFVRPGWGYIMEFYIRPEYRRRGFGCAMFLHLEGHFRRHGAARMYLTADPITGKPFWEAMGFQNIGVPSPENKLDIYEKQLGG